jgi:hypothetical protein
LNPAAPNGDRPKKTPKESRERETAKENTARSSSSDTSLLDVLTHACHGGAKSKRSTSNANANNGEIMPITTPSLLEQVMTCTLTAHQHNNQHKDDDGDFTDDEGTFKTRTEDYDEHSFDETDMGDSYESLSDDMSSRRQARDRRHHRRR